ncbi:myb-binding protein 1A-like protein [Leptidea sinapis]|uniref:DNA polymerase V n=1 Tax=Leptidea sinapis TaxID=189913 RepID=A0A5E4QWN3_9NEOP|nr:myb-binding protein 1A-like protein [Leptidea sinapis]VVD02152.1 unnamed protein product [Leptidea sinapis]
MKESTTNKPQREVTASLLDYFGHLTSKTNEVKLKGATDIIRQLERNKNEKDVSYSLRRLVRSLGANIAELRTGYFATLVNLLQRFDDITVSQLLDLVKKELHANGSSKSEVGDVSLGHILVCGAVFRSGLMLKSSEDEQKQILEVLEKAGAKKSYLNTVASLTLLDFIENLDEEKFKQIIWKNVKPRFKKPINEYNMSSLHFLLVVSRKFPKAVKITKLLGVPTIIHEDHIKEICDILLSGVDFGSVSHPIYEEIGKQVAKGPLMVEFWLKVDSYLVKHNRNRELVALNILNTIFLNVDSKNYELIPDLISNNFFKLFLDWFKGLQTASKIRSKREDEDDHKLMIKTEKDFLNTVAKALKSESITSSIRVNILKKLLINPGEINLAEITGSSIIKSIIADLDISGVKEMAKLFKKVLLNSSKKVVKDDVERNWYNNEKIKAAELISHLVSHETVRDDTSFKIKYMQILMCFGFFKISGEDNIPVSSEMSGSIKTSFYRCFSSKFTNVDGLVTLLSSLCNFISVKVMEKSEIREKLEKQFSKENIECWDILIKMCDKIEKHDSKSKVDKVFLILLYQLGLFLYSEPTHVKIAQSSILELKSCFEHYKKSDGKQFKGDSSMDDEPEWIEVMIEILLSILSIESSVLRSIVQCVFRLLWEYLTPTSIGQIISVLDPESEDNPLTNDSESEKESDDQSDDDSVQDSVKENGLDKNSDTDESEGSDDEKDDDDMKTPDQLRMAVQKVLGAATLDDDAESIDADNITEEEGNKLDEALAEAFRQFHQGKNGKSKKDRKNKKSLSDFRIRVLDLIDIYLEKEPSMDICVGMIAPLTRCLEFCMLDNQFNELENRLRKTIKTLAKVKKFTSTDDITVDILCDHLKAIIDKGTRSHFMYQALGDVITSFATFIIHCSQKILGHVKSKKQQLSPLVIILQETMTSFFLNRNCLLPIIFFHSILQMEWKDRCELVPIIITNIFSNDVRQFRRHEGVELLIGFYRGLNRNKTATSTIEEKILSIERHFETALLAVKSNLEFKVKKNFVKLVKKLINIIRSVHENCQIQTELDFSNLLNLVSELKFNLDKSAPAIQNPVNGKKKKNKKKRKNSIQANGDEPKLKKIKSQ